MVFLLVLVAVVVTSATITHKDISPCKRISDAEKKQCQAREVDRMLGRPDIARAWKLVAQFSRDDPSFAETCHGLTHSIGKTAYKLFVQNKSIPITKETSYCSYGFYHGFMETLLKDGSPAAAARDFCDRVARETKSILPDARYACFHGIGHGWTNIHEPALFGNEKAMAFPALFLCQEVARDKDELLRCATGVFDSISIAYYNKQAGLIVKKDDPLWLCRAVAETFREACYRDMMPAILWLGNYLLSQSVLYVEKFVPKEYAEPAIATLASNSVRYTIGTSEDWQRESLAVCRLLRDDLRIPCASGLATGMMEFGQPQKEYILALSLCRKDDLSRAETDVCFQSVLNYIGNRYPKEKAQALCQSIESQYQKYCKRL